MSEEETTLQEVARTTDTTLRFWLALISMAIVLGSVQGAQLITQGSIQETQQGQQSSIVALRETVTALAVSNSSTAIQTQTYQQGAIARDVRMEQDIDRLEELLTQLLQQVQ